MYLKRKVLVKSFFEGGIYSDEGITQGVNEGGLSNEEAGFLKGYLEGFDSE